MLPLRYLRRFPVFTQVACFLSSASGHVHSPPQTLEVLPQDHHHHSPSPSTPTSTSLPGVNSGGEDGFYLLMFTCTKCDTRTARRISKSGYHTGSVLVRCPGCLNLHLVSDHLGFFNDDAVDAEALLRGEEGTTPARVDPSVYEFNAADLAVLASSGKSVRLGTGEQLPVVGFDGVLEKSGREGAGGGDGGSSSTGGGSTSKQ